MRSRAAALPRIGALRSWRVARRACTPTCFGYHGSWKLFARTNLKGQPFWHLDFYRAAARQAKRSGDGALRVLIAGAADEAMLRVVDEVFGGDGPLEVVLLDRCRTPLELSRSCLRSSGRDLPLALVHGLVQETELEPESFDVVITDGLFSFMGDAGERETIIARLDACLAPGGLLVYSTRVTQGERALEYDTLGRVVQALTVLTWPGPWRERLRLARSQLRRPARTSPFRSTEEFRAAFAAFPEVEVSVDDAAPARALRLHPNFARGTGSRCVRVLALK